MKIIIDSRMRKQEKEYLSNFGELIEIFPQESVYEEISAHPDIFFCKLDNTIFRTPNLDMDIGIVGKEAVGYKYPEDVKYNIGQIGNFVIHNFKYTDKKILDYIHEKNLEKINVKQGYANCSISTISNNACITSDDGIYKQIRNRNIDCLYVNSNNIFLLNKNGIPTQMGGFIGGATCVIEDKFILFGDIDYLQQKEELLEFLKKYNLQLVCFKNLKIYDYGGILVY